MSDLLKLSTEIQQWRDERMTLQTHRATLLRAVVLLDQVLEAHARGVDGNALLLAARRDRSHFTMMQPHTVTFLADKFFGERQPGYTGKPFNLCIDKVR